MADADVALLRDMFASVDLDVIKIVLAECGNNVERAIDALLQLDPASGGGGGAPAPASKPAAPAKPAPAAPKAPSYDQDFNPRAAPAPAAPKQPAVDDEALARALQAQLNADDADAELARKLAAEEQEEASSRYSQNAYQAPVASQPKYRANMSIGDFLGAVTADDMEEMVDTIKEQMIPLIVEQMQQVNVPPINEEIDSPGLGSRLSFTVSGIALDHIEVPKDNVTCAIQNGGFKISIGNIAARVKKFNWSYKKETFPKLKDDGHAKAAFSDTTVTLVLQLNGSSLQSTRVNVSECNVKIGKLDVKIGGTVASFIYNIIIAAFSSSIRKSIEGQMQDMIRTAINESASSLLEDM